MIKIIIADDEKIIRERLVSKIDWESMGYEVVAQASNGIELFEKTIDKRPDVVITDIRMPEMDGVEYVENLKKQNISTQVIAISGYSKFEYAQKLMNMGVYAYLLKPIDKVELYKYLSALRDKILLKKSEEFSQKIRRIKESILNDEKAEFTLINGISSSIFVCLSFNGSETVRESLRKKIPEYFSKFFENSGVIFEKEKTLAFLCQVYDVLKIEQTLFGLIDYIEADNVNNSDFKGALLYYSSVVEDAEDFAGGLEKIKQISEIVPFSEERGVYNMYTLDFEERFNQYICPHEDELEIIKLLNAGETIMIGNKIAQLHSQMLDGKVSFLGMKQCYFYLLNSIYRSLIEANKVNQKIKSDIFSALKKMEKAVCVDELSECIISVVVTLCEEVSILTDGYLNVYFEKAIEYMNNHFGENISLGDIAEHLGVSYGYLGYIFKQNSKRGFVKLLRDIRIKEAKRLLAVTDSKVYEVSELCGFENPRYFAEIFRHETGVNPLEYRRKNRKK